MRPQVGSSRKGWVQMVRSQAETEMWLPSSGPRGGAGGLVFCSELCTEGFQQLELPRVLGWVSEMLATSQLCPPRCVRVLLGAPVCRRRAESERGMWTGNELEDRAVLRVQKRGEGCWNGGCLRRE